MSEAIQFDCTSCGMPYKVAASYAGREFACKKCGARLCVPQPGQQAGFQVETSVEMGSGTEVMRRTTPSGRQVTVDPTRVFKRERETSQRMGAVGGEQKEKSGKGLLIAGVLVGVIALGGVIGAVVVLGGEETETPQNSGKTVAIDTPEEKEPSERDKLMARVEEASDAGALLALFGEAGGKVDDADLTVIAQHLVRAVSSEGGGTLSDEQIMGLAKTMAERKVAADSDRLYMVIIGRHRGAEPPPPVYVTAREKLGYTRLEFDPHIERAQGLGATGVVEGMAEVVSSLEDMKKRTDDGWSTMADKVQFEAALGRITEAEAKVEEIRKSDPFQFKLVSARLEFSKEKASGIGNWISVGRDPYVIFVQLLSRETEEQALERLAEALKIAEAFPEFFNSELRESLNLKRTLPNTLPAAEREDAPIVIKLFRDASYWRAYLKDHGYGEVDATRARTFTEPGNGHVSMVYERDAGSSTTYIGNFIRALIDVSMYNFHPNAPTTHEEDENFRAYQAYFLDVYLHRAISITTRSRDTGDFTFWARDSRAPVRLKQWQQPFAKDSNDRFNSFGGQVLTVRDFVSFTDADGMRKAVSDKLETLEGWTESDLMVARQTTNLNTIASGYLSGLYDFLFHWGPGGEPKYRAKFLEFVRMDLAGEVSKDNPLPAFEKAFGLNEAGWKELEADFTTYQTE